MFGLSSHSSEKCGVVIDIGSGSVGAAIFISHTNMVEPEIVWSHREYVLIKDMSSTEVPLKEITTSIINIFLQLGTNGITSLREKSKGYSIDAVQVTVSAPWTYTVTKTVNFSDEHPFEVTKELLRELSMTAEDQAFTAVLENEILKESQLEIIDNKTINTTINGYQIENPRKMRTREVSLAHITAITQAKIISVLEDSKNKIIPKAELTTHSFMYMYYDVLKHMNPDTTEACLIDVTSEATEIGIIREGILTHVTHSAFGTFSLAREISSLCNIPKEEAYTYLKGGTSFIVSKLSKAKVEEIGAILESYEEKIAELFKTTGDILSIPKTLFLHCEISTEDFFTKRMVSAAKKATNMKHNVHPITSLLFSKTSTKDTALLLSAHYYHLAHIQEVKKDT